MKVEILGSGSSGNCAVIDDYFMIDIGVNVSPKGEVVLLTHHHSDHTKYLENVAGLPVFCLNVTAEFLNKKHPYYVFNVFDDGIKYNFKDYSVRSIRLVHDAPCVGYEIFKMSTSERILFMTDFNTIVEEDYIIKRLRNKDYDAIYIEGNNTLNSFDFMDCYETGMEDFAPPKDAFHRKRSYQNHCNIGYLIELFTRAGYSRDNTFKEPVMLMHKSSYYYTSDVSRIAELLTIANVVNPFFEEGTKNYTNQWNGED